MKIFDDSCCVYVVETALGKVIAVCSHEEQENLKAFDRRFERQTGLEVISKEREI